jgi:hypothetical protein
MTHRFKRVRALALILPTLAGLLACSPTAVPTPLLPPEVKPCALPPDPTPTLLPLPTGSAFFIPQAPAHPYFKDRDEVIRQAHCISDALEGYVKAWLDGRASADIPEAFLPKGYPTSDYKNFRLVKPEDVRPEDQWATRPAEPIDPSGLRDAFPDPNVTYLVLPTLYIPFGGKLVMDGEFPHARFMSIQVTPSFEPENYRYDGGTGVGEVPIVDADIEPLPGNTNPFRVGADRSATKRTFRVTYDMAVGDPVALNAAFRPPYFRQAGNQRVGGALMYQGPWGSAKSGTGHKRGLWDFGQVWIRYYAPDMDKGAFAGVKLPKVSYQLADGRRFFIQADLSGFVSKTSKRVPGKADAPAEPDPKALLGPTDGWNKQAGIFRSIISGIAIGTGWAGPGYVRDLDRGVTGRGEALPAPANYEQSATSCTYIDYLVRGMSLGANKVVVLTGKLPTFPQTRGGEATMQGAQIRYWSLTGYVQLSGLDFLQYLDPNTPIGLAQHGIMDDEVVLDANRRYVIALSRPEERPANATAANGVTWVNWGPHANISWTLRWMSVGPEWTFPLAPSPSLFGTTADWASPDFDKNALNVNGHSGKMGEYQPEIHYLGRAQFEALGSNPDPTKIPSWK